MNSCHGDKGYRGKLSGIVTVQLPTALSHNGSMPKSPNFASESE